MNQLKPPKIHEGIIIAGTTLLGYSIAFLYEAGYVGYFGIPQSLMTIGLTEVFVATAVLVSIFLIFLVLANSISSFIPESHAKNPLVVRVIRQFPVLFLAATLLFLYRFHIQDIYFLLITVFLLLFLEFIFPLLTQKQKKGYFTKLEAQDQFEESTYSLLKGLTSRLGPTYTYVVLWVIIIMTLSYYAGRAEAFKKEYFFIHANNRETVVLRVYGDTVISSKFDTKNHQLVGELWLQKLSDKHSLKLMRQKVGPLIPKK